MGVDDLLQKHSLLEADIKVIGERVKSVNAQADPFSTESDDDSESPFVFVGQHRCVQRAGIEPEVLLP